MKAVDTLLKRASIPLSLLLLLAPSPQTLAKSNEKPGLLLNLEAQILYDDNIYRSARTESDDNIFVLQPTAYWLAVSGAHQFSLNYVGDYGRYFEEDNLNYSDHKFTTTAKLDHSSRLNTDHTFEYHKSVDKPGSNDATFLPGESPDKWHTTQFKSKVTYGNTDSHGQLVGQLAYDKERYTNNDGNFRDNNELQATGTFFYRVAPRTRMLFEFDYVDSDYQNDDIFGSNQSNQKYSYLTGVTWEATAKTTGVFKLGYREQTYENKRFGNISGLALWLDGHWQPTAHTKVTFGASRDTEDSARQGASGSTQTVIHGGVEHGMTERVRLTSQFKLSNEDFDGNQSREDDRQYFSLGAKYSLRRWLDIGCEYQFEQRDSSQGSFNFTSHVFMLSVTTRFEN